MDLSALDQPPLDAMIYAFAEQYPTAAVAGEIDQRSYDQGVLVGIAMTYVSAAAEGTEDEAEAVARANEIIDALRDRVADARFTLLAG